MAERYIITDAVVCSVCNKPLWKLQDRWYPKVEPELMHNTLEVELHGGYGMFFDNIHGDYKLTLCHDCAHKLVGSSPFLTRLLKGGHFHGWTDENDIHSPLNEDITDFHKDWGKL
jgi:hypothetical protein